MVVSEIHTENPNRSPLAPSEADSLAVSVAETHIPAGLVKHSINLAEGASNSDSLYLEINVEDGTTGIEAQLANDDGSLDGSPIVIRVHGQL